MSDKIEGVSKTQKSANLNNESAQETNQDKFQEMMDSKNTSLHSSFEVVEQSSVAATMNQKDVEEAAALPNEQDVESNPLGSATDQEKGNQKGRQDDDSADEIEGVSATSRKSKTGASQSVESSAVQKSGSSGSEVDLKSIQAQNDQSVAKMQEAKELLTKANGANVEIKSSYQKLLKNRLQHVDDSISTASTKLGIENPQVPIESSSKMNPMERFITMLTSSQDRMDKLKVSVDDMAAKGAMNPGQMLALQLKSNLITQEMELFSSLLGKALEGFKAIMNVQV